MMPRYYTLVYAIVIAAAHACASYRCCLQIDIMPDVDDADDDAVAITLLMFSSAATRP